MAATGRPGIIGAVVIVVLAVAACGDEDDPAASSPPATPAPSVSTTTTVAPTTTVVGVPPEHLTSCVDNAKFLAFTGNDFWAGMWADAGRTDAGMRAVCEFLGDEDPAVLADIHRDWVALQEQTTTTTTTTTVAEVVVAPTGAADPSLVATCVAWVDANRRIGTPRAVALWENLGGSTSAIREACTAIARDNPAEAEAMQAEMESP